MTDKIAVETHGESSRVRIAFDADESHSADTQCDGWQAILDNFAACVKEAQP